MRSRIRLSTNSFGGSTAIAQPLSARNHEGHSLEVSLSHWHAGVQIDTLEEWSVLTACTLHTRYEIVVGHGAPGDVLVRGGRYFPEWTAARLVGSTLGGSVLKQFGIHLGWHLEFRLEDRHILTSPVRSVTLQRRDQMHRHGSVWREVGHVV